MQRQQYIFYFFYCVVKCVSDTEYGYSGTLKLFLSRNKCYLNKVVFASMTRGSVGSHIYCVQNIFLIFLLECMISVML